MARRLVVLIILIFVATMFLAVAKIRSPQARFDRVALGMTEEQVAHILGMQPGKLDPRMRPYEIAWEGSGNSNEYQLGLYRIGVHFVEGVAVNKAIQFMPPEIRPVEEKGQTFSF